MEGVYTRSFDRPDEVIEVDKVRSAIVGLSGMAFSRDIQYPGWRWSEHVRPRVGTEWCEARHVGYVLRGRMRIQLRDGTEFDCHPGDVIDIPAGHDGWILGDEPFESVSWMGATTWLSPLHTLRERVLVTLVFTDIVGSTEVARRLGDRVWGDLISGHNQRMADTVDRFRGRLAKFTGDGMLAMFDGTARAIRCALACRQQADDLGLAIRAAVHTGEIDLAGEEVQGIAVHEAARIMSHAGAGEVLVSDLTRALARDPEIGFDDRGEFELRGAGGSMRLHAVQAAGMGDPA